jgi:hypothetical protein
VVKLVPFLPDHFLRRVALGTVVGAIAAFAWAYVSWSSVRLYDWAVQPIPAEAEVSAAIARAVPKDGAYAFPWIDMDAARAASPEARRATVDAWRARMQDGPVGVLLVRQQGKDPLAPQRYLTGAGYLAFCSFLMSVLMAAMRCPSWAGRWAIGMVIALFAAMAADGPDLAWFQLPARWVYMGIADTFLTWTVASAAIAAVVRPVPAPASTGTGRGSA